MSNDTYDVEISLDGDSTIVYTLTLKNQLDVTDAVTKSLESSAKQQEDTLKALIPQFESQTSTKGISIKVAFVNADGTTIYETEFKN